MEKIEKYRPGLAKNQVLVKQLRDFQENPRSLIFVSLAETYRLEGLPQQSLDILEEGLVFHPSLASALVCRARCLFDLRRYSEALTTLTRVLVDNPQNIKALKVQSEIFLRLGQRKSAMRALTKVIQAFPQDLESVRALEELENLETNQFVPVRHIFQASTDAPPEKLGKIEDFHVENLKTSFTAIEAPKSEGSAKATEIAYEEVEDSEPTFATRTIAELYLRQGLKHKALAVLRKILKNDSGNVWARETLQNLESDGIVLPENKSRMKGKEAFGKKAKALEHMLVRVQLLKRINA
jgi:tetratricopeptide (TPR) repeat protein